MLATEFPSTHAWISFSCKDEQYTNHGELFVDCVKLANKSKQVVAVGINCTDPSKNFPLHFLTGKVYVEGLLRSVKENYPENSKHLLVYPNRGEIWDTPSRSWQPRPGCKHRRVVDYVPTWLSLGATILGGCCRTTPEDISQIAKIVNG